MTTIALPLTWTGMITTIRHEFPDFEVVEYRQNWFFRILWKLGWRMGATTIGNRVYMHWSLIGTGRGADVLWHELVHLRDQRRWKVLFFLTYFLLPVGPSFKAYWEWRAFRADMELDFRKYGIVSEYTINQIVESMVGPSYAWMWPFRKTVRRWCFRYRNVLQAFAPVAQG